MTNALKHSTGTNSSISNNSVLTMDVSLGNSSGGGDEPTSAAAAGQEQQPPPLPLPGSGNTETLHLRWTNIFKSVEIKDDASTTANNNNNKKKNKTGSIHPTTTANNNNYKKSSTTTTTTNTKVILDHVSGEARPGEILATMVGIANS